MFNVNEYLIKRNKCPACDGIDFNQIYSCKYTDNPISGFLKRFYSKQGHVDFRFLQEAEYSVLKCQDCDMIFQEYYPGEKLSLELYENWIDPKYDLSVKRNVYYYSIYSQEIQSVINYFNKAPCDISVLDYGMGWSRWLRMASGFGCDSHGLDLAEDKRNYAEKYGLKVIDIDDLNNRKFMFINSDQVFEHLPDPYKNLCHLKNALAENGILKIAVPNDRNVENNLKINNWRVQKQSKNSLSSISPLEHINCFSRKSLIAMAKRTGLKEVRMPLKVLIKSSGFGLRNIVRMILRNKGFFDNYIFFTHLN